MDTDLQGFENEGMIARNLVRNKPPAWKYHLTVELLRARTHTLGRTWMDAKRMVHIGSLHPMPADEATLLLRQGWTGIGPIATALVDLLRTALNDAMARERPAIDILRACDALAETAGRIVSLGMEITRAALPRQHEDLRSLMIELVDHFLDEFEDISRRLSKVVINAEPGSSETLTFTFTAPPHWQERIQAAARRLVD
ncbi:hypothetical protein [Nitrospirillum pindoramense]|uniref:Uncharacterized protein n=1 Tax=Nitrospirillum amazonense TaxID=28077 RepID=A0A560GX29_9PROT|nr:hypothetical protein [Nitrospirillum amazonense]TWB38595.1 hypothetical protein FBZ90_11284 [Nitrospirillum amazonense]